MHWARPPRPPRPTDQHQPSNQQGEAMSSISEHYSLPAQTKAQRPHTRGHHPSPRPRPRPQVAALQNSGLTPIMGPDNHAPGVSIMGMASSGPYLMGGADA